MALRAWEGGGESFLYFSVAVLAAYHAYSLRHGQAVPPPSSEGGRATHRPYLLAVSWLLSLFETVCAKGIPSNQRNSFGETV